MNSSSNNFDSNNYNNDLSSKDVLINQLKNRIFELEQLNKNFESLQDENLKLKQLIDEIKQNQLRNDYESNQKITIQHNQLNEYRSENETLNNILNEKLNINKKLYADNETLLSELNKNNSDIANLTNKLNEALHNNEGLKNDMSKFEKINYDLNNNIKFQN